VPCTLHSNYLYASHAAPLSSPCGAAPASIWANSIQPFWRSSREAQFAALFAPAGCTVLGGLGRPTRDIPEHLAAAERRRRWRRLRWAGGWPARRVLGPTRGMGRCLHAGTGVRRVMCGDAGVFSRQNSRLGELVDVRGSSSESPGLCSAGSSRQGTPGFL